MATTHVTPTVPGIAASGLSRDSRLRDPAYDIALRDFGLLVGALALARLATAFSPAAPHTGAAR